MFGKMCFVVWILIFKSLKNSVLTHELHIYAPCSVFLSLRAFKKPFLHFHYSLRSGPLDKDGY